MFAWILLASNSTTVRPDVVAEGLFQIIAATCFLYALLAGPLFTTDCLGYERREGTLGLLFLTDLRGYDVVLGKFVATSIHAVFALVATLPVMAIPILLGGVTSAQFWHVSWALLVTVFFSLTLGLLWSTLARDLRQSMIGTLVTLGLLLGGTYFVEWLVRRATKGGHPQWLVLNPLRSFLLAFDQNRTGPQGELMYLDAVRWQFVVGLLLLAAAAMVVARRWRKESLWEPDQPVPESNINWSAEDPRLFIGYRHIRWQAWLDANPYYWLARMTRPSEGLLRVWMVLGCSMCAGLLLMSLNGPQAAKENFALAALGMAFVLHLGVKLVAAMASTRTLQDDRNSGALELMMVSGLHAKEILSGHRGALNQQFFPSLVILTFLNLLLLVRIHLPLDPVGGAERGAITVALLVGMIFIWVDVRACITIGAQQSLKAGTQLMAIRGCIVRALAPAWISAALLIGVTMASGNPGLLTARTVLWLITCVGWHAFFVSRAELDLESGFKLLAAGLDFDRGEASLRRSFQRAAGTQYMQQ